MSSARNCTQLKYPHVCLERKAPIDYADYAPVDTHSLFVAIVQHMPPSGRAYLNLKKRRKNRSNFRSKTVFLMFFFTCKTW